MPFFLINFRHSKIETASIEKNNLILFSGGENASVLTLSGEGEAKITVKNISGWVSVPNTVELSSSSKEVPISIEVPYDVASGEYFGSIVITTKENTVELPLTLVINNPPILNSVSLSSDIVKIGEYITFTTNATDRDGDDLTIFVCGDPACDEEWYHEAETYCSVHISDDEPVGEKEYYIKVCDHIFCSSIKSGTFTVTLCVNGETKSCTDEHGCDGIQTCDDEEWGSCVSVQNWCDEDCDGEPETCKSEDCKICPLGYIYVAYNSICYPCRNLAYNLIEDVIGNGAPHSDVELKLWTDDDIDFVASYVEENYEDLTSYHWEEIKAAWINIGVPESAFPNPFGSWTSDNFDILDAIGSYVCVCTKTHSCYCDELIGEQPVNNGCIDNIDSGCEDETEECGDGICPEKLEPMVEDTLESFGV